MTEPSLKQVRTYLGLDQKEMAVLLGISRTYIAMAESKRRLLPAKHMLLLTAIFQVIEDKRKQLSKEDDFLRQEENKREELIKRSLLRKKDEIVFAKNDLKLLQEMQSRISEINGLVPTIEELIPGKGSSILLSKMNKHKKKYSQSRRLFLELKIKALEAELEFLQSQ